MKYLYVLLILTSIAVTVNADKHFAEKEIIRLFNEHCVKNSELPFKLDESIQKEKHIYEVQKLPDNVQVAMGIDSKYHYTAYYLSNKNNYFSIHAVNKNYGCQVSTINLDTNRLIKLLSSNFKVKDAGRNKYAKYFVSDMFIFNKSSTLYGSVINMATSKSEKKGNIAIDIRYVPIEFFPPKLQKEYKEYAK